MNKHVQIRSLPEPMHRKLKARAAEEGLSISEYLKRLIDRDLKRPGWAEIEARMKRLTPIALPESTAEMIRRERDSR
jgi:plasmid stability protein